MTSSDQDNLKNVILACQKGQSWAQEVIYKKLYGKMMGICYRYAQHHEEAKDLFHDAFLKLLQVIKKYDFSAPFEAWAIRVMKNYLIDGLRKRKYITDFDDVENYLDAQEYENEKLAEYLELLDIHDIIEAMQKLSPAYKLVFNLFAIEGYGHKEIAQMLHISEGTSKSNYAKAKKKLKKILEQKLKVKTKQND
jgi:RNA polymerase sigma-70 factor (ECF subfamily)